MSEGSQSGADENSRLHLRGENHPFQVAALNQKAEDRRRIATVSPVVIGASNGGLEVHSLGPRPSVRRRMPTGEPSNDPVLKRQGAEAVPKGKAMECDAATGDGLQLHPKVAGEQGIEFTASRIGYQIHDAKGYGPKSFTKVRGSANSG
jgi:hypothetical protein